MAKPKNPYATGAGLDDAVRDYAPLVKKIAYQIASRMPANVEVNDLIQEGMTGLLDALQRFVPQPNLGFEVYARTRIRGAIYDACRRNDILPRYQRDQINQLESVIGTLEHELGRAPDDSEIATRAGMDLTAYHEVMSSNISLMPIDELPEEHGPIDEDNDPLQRTSMKQLAGKLAEALSRLPEKEQMVMSLHYQEDLSYREIATVLNLTPGRISQLHTQAVIRIRAILGERPGKG